MGEFVSEMQERLLPQYEQMRQYQIFNPEQIRECIRQREKLMLGVTKSHIGIADYLDFIVYENKLHKTITEKEKLTGLKLMGLKASIATHIMRIYREMLVKFAHEERLWANYIKFCKKASPQEVAGIYEKMLSDDPPDSLTSFFTILVFVGLNASKTWLCKSIKEYKSILRFVAYHGGEPATWKNAALWVYEYNQNIVRVQDILLRGLQRHPSSALLYKCFFDIELKEAAQADSKRNLGDNTLSVQDIQMERVTAVYRNCLANITDLDFFLKLLESCEDHSELTAKLQYIIICNVQEKFSREPALWDALAKRELRGFHLGDLQALTRSEDISEPHLETSVWQSRSKKRCIELCVTVYKAAVQQLQTQEMWSLYLDAMLLLSKSDKTERAFVQQCLATALQEGHSSKLMPAKYYATLSTMLHCTDNGAKACVKILTEALQHDKSLRMYELLLNTHIRLDDEASVHKMFHEVRRTIGAPGLPLWQSAISYYHARGDIHAKRRLNDIYMQACKEVWPEFAELRCSYLRYLWHEISPSKARDEYAKLALQPPMSLQLHREMIKLIRSTILQDSSIKFWRMCLQFMTNHFGEKEPRVWVDYIVFERDYGDTKNISLIGQRALATLDPQLVSVFETERAMAHIGIMQENI